MYGNIIYIIVLIISLLIAALLLFWPKAVVTSDSFAMCLRKAGAVMYGTDTCDSCKRQKYIFGDDFISVQYINCDFNQEVCNANKISGYPTWIFNGQMITGTKSLEELSNLTGCRL